MSETPLQQLVNAIRWKIAKEGTQASPFLLPSFNQYREEFLKGQDTIVKPGLEAIESAEKTVLELSKENYASKRGDLKKMITLAVRAMQTKGKQWVRTCTVGAWKMARELAPKASGNLKASIQWEREDKGSTYSGVVYSTADYAPFPEGYFHRRNVFGATVSDYARAPGKPPPYKPIEDWVKAKGLVTNMGFVKKNKPAKKDANDAGPVTIQGPGKIDKGFRIVKNKPAKKASGAKKAARINSGRIVGNRKAGKR